MVDGSSVALGIIGLLLIATVGAGNVVVAGQQTVMSEEFVTTQFEEENLYGVLEDTITDAVEDQLGNATGGESPIPGANLSLDPVAIADEVVTESYVKNQTETNVGRLYAYLHGETDELVLSFDLRPLKDNVGAAVGDAVAEVDPGALIAQGLEEYEGEVPFDASLVERLGANESSYQAARQEFRTDIRDAVLNRMANETYDAAENETEHDALLALVIDDYDPRQYTFAEKQQMVEDRESEIKAALREQVVEERGDELDSRIEETIDERHDAVRAEVANATERATSDQSDDVTAAAVDMNVAVVDGLMGDIAYAEYTDRVEEATARLGEEAERLALETVDEQVPDSIDATEQFGEDASSAFEGARDAFGLVGLLGLLLPLVSLGLVGLAYAASRSVERTLRTTGIAVIIAGAAGFIAATLLGDPVETTIRDALSGSEMPQLVDAIVGIFESVLSTLSTQSLLLAGLGVVLVAAAFGSRYLGDDDASTEVGDTAGNGDTDPLADRAETEQVTDDATSETESTTADEGTGDTEDGAEVAEAGAGDADGGEESEGTAGDDGEREP